MVDDEQFLADVRAHMDEAAAKPHRGTYVTLEPNPEPTGERCPSCHSDKVYPVSWPETYREYEHNVFVRTRRVVKHGLGCFRCWRRW